MASVRSRGGYPPGLVAPSPLPCPRPLTHLPLSPSSVWPTMPWSVPELSTPTPLQVFPSKKSVWLRAAYFEKNHGTRCVAGLPPCSAFRLPIPVAREPHWRSGLCNEGWTLPVAVGPFQPSCLSGTLHSIPAAVQLRSPGTEGPICLQ